MRQSTRSGSQTIETIPSQRSPNERSCLEPVGGVTSFCLVGGVVYFRVGVLPFCTAPQWWHQNALSISLPQEVQNVVRGDASDVLTPSSIKPSPDSSVFSSTSSSRAGLTALAMSPGNAISASPSSLRELKHSSSEDASGSSPPSTFTPHCWQKTESSDSSLPQEVQSLAAAVVTLPGNSFAYRCPSP